MSSEENYYNFKSMESDIIKELYKKTPLKKRPIQSSSLSPDDKRISPKPRACTLPEGRLSKRKMLKPTKKRIDSYAESAAVVESSPMAMYVPVIKSTTESKPVNPAKVNNKVVRFAVSVAIPEVEKTSVRTKVPSRTSKCSKALSNRNLTQQEWEDLNLAIELQKEEFNLRERRPRATAAPDLSIKSKSRRLPAKTKRTSSESMESNYISSPETAHVEDFKEDRSSKRISKQSAICFGLVKDAFTGSQSKKMYDLSPELANIVGHKKMTGNGIIEAMNYVFLERNLLEADKKNVICDDELSEKLFAGKRRLRIDDMKKYLNKHLALSSD